MPLQACKKYLSAKPHGKLFVSTLPAKSAVVSRTVPASGPAPRHSLQQSPCPPAAADCGKENTPAASRANQSEPARFEAVGKIVFLGNGTWIPKVAFDRLMKHQKDSVFVREACVEIFSVAGLVGRSVTGGISNRTKAKPKPALDAAKFAALDGPVGGLMRAEFLI
ncbi:hypothetical protein V5799_017638, partial [Amblyomma americanum]